MLRVVLASALMAVGLAGPASAATHVVSSGRLTAEIDDAPFALRFADAGRHVLVQHPDVALGFRTAAGWARATRAVSVGRDGDALVAELETTDVLGRRLALRVSPDGEGVVALAARVTGGPDADVTATGAGFAAAAGERYLGFGERSNAVDQRGNEVESYVGEGAYQPEERPFITAFVPPWSIRQRDDATYFPMPWLLSTGGFGVLVDNTEVSRFDLARARPDAWSVEVDARDVRLRVFAGPRPADVVRRLGERVGRQPTPDAEWFFGPWFQTGQGNQVPEEREYLARLQRADAPVSAAETHMRYLPCGAHEDQRDAERARTGFFHGRGLATLTYYQEKICTTYERAFQAARERDALIRNAAGEPYVYPAYLGEVTPPTRPMGLIDFTAPRAQELYDLLLSDAVEDGHDGWMEDFGESMPPDGRAANGMDGTQLHNLYPVPYHRAGQDFATRAPRPLARFVRSGWTGVHAYAPIVWGGDPTTGWGYDGLRSAVWNALTMGLSGISTWGSDIGGYHALGLNELTPELLVRWIQFGAVSAVMRTKAGGVALPPKARPQIWDEAILPHWRRWARLHTQLNPYLRAATHRYRRTGMPLMAHLALVAPGDERAAARDDEFLFGPHLLAAPVLEPGARRRALYLPRGRWVDLWRAVGYDDRRGGLRLGRAVARRGGREVELPAPLGELPLLARAGAVLPLLAPDVDTLAGYGARAAGVVRLADRRDRMELLAFPRGTSAAAFNDGESLRSVERRRRWTLGVDGARRRTYRLQASMSTLRRPFVPCRVALGGRPLARGTWRYDRRTGALRARFAARDATLTVTACRRGARRGARGARPVPRFTG